MHKIALGLLFVSLTMLGAHAVVYTSACDAEREAGESACRVQGNTYLSQLSDCQVKVNRNYANCAQRLASFDL